MLIKNNITANYEKRIDELIETTPLPDMDTRFRIIEELNEEFFQLTGKTLPYYLVNKLSDWVLSEVLKDKDVDKVANNEFAILSLRQLRRRDKRELSVGEGLVDYLNQKYVKQVGSLYKKTKQGGAE